MAEISALPEEQSLGKIQGFSGRHIHFIGIGGIGMSGIASLLSAQGYFVSGSDIKESPQTRKLSEKGIRIFLGHESANLDGAQMVVYSSAIKNENPELAAARESGLAVMHRAEVLAKMMRDKTTIAVSGSHGKTTTTALIGHLLLEAGFHPTLAAGGVLRNVDDNACLGKSDFFVAEADESDGTFLYYSPDYPIVTNIDREHLDYYKSLEDIIAAYRKFISNAKDSGCLFCCGDDANIRQIARGSGKRIIYFGLSGENDFYPQEVTLNEFSSHFTYCRNGKAMGEVTLPLSGTHNISNSLSVIALGLYLGISRARIEEAFAAFKGTERRFQLKCDAGGIRLIDDYGHHPAEIRATLSAAKNLKAKRLIVIFQPHRYSRTKFLMDEFAESFSAADCLIITDIYGASEEPIAGVSSEVLCEKIKEMHPLMRVVYARKESVIERILDIAEPQDVVVTLGAGDIGKLSDELAGRIKGKNTF